jgi:hypothetical protein
MGSIPEGFFHEYDWRRLDYVVDEDRESLRRNYEREQRKGLPQYLACPCDSPACTDLLYDPVGVLSDRGRWPMHLCYEAFLRASTENWARQTTIISGNSTHRFLTEHPLPIGRQAIQQNQYLRMDHDWKELFQRVPFDGDEAALWALRIAREGSALDLFGLAEYPTEEHRREGVAVMGRLAYVLRGGDISLIDLVRAAGHWWKRFRGLPVGGRPVNTGTWGSAEEFKEALQTAIRMARGQKRGVTQEAVADFFTRETGFPNCDDSQLRRWIRHYGLDWKELRTEA